MNLSLEKVFQLRTLLYMQKLVHFNSVSYIDKTRIAALSGLHLHNKAFTTLSRWKYLQALFTCCYSINIGKRW